MRAWAVEHGIDAENVDGFTRRALALILGLHAGTLHRYGLRESDYEAWKALYSSVAEAPAELDN